MSVLFQRIVICGLVICSLSAPPVFAGYGDNNDPLTNVEFDQSHLGDQIPLDLVFQDEQGKAVRLGDYFGEKPVILNLVYFECPKLCNVVMDELQKTLAVMEFSVGKEFNVLTVSFDPYETKTQALRKKTGLLRRYNREGAEEGWDFLTADGDKETVRRLTESVGFHYTYDKEKGRYSHPSGIIVLTPDGKISRYLQGLEHTVDDVKFSLMDASEEKIGSVTDQVRLLCYLYDPTIGKYGLAIHRVTQVLGTITAACVAGMVVFYLRREKLAPRDEPSDDSAGDTRTDVPITDN